MPFESEKQRRFMWAKHPEIAKRWAKNYPESNKNLPMYAHDNKDKSDEKAAALGALTRAIQGLPPNFINLTPFSKSAENVKAGNSGMVKVDLPHSDKPTYAGEERAKGDMDQEGNPKTEGKPENTGPEAISAIFGKLSAVLAQPFREMMETQQALEEGRDPRFVPQNLGVRRYSVPSPTIAPPMGMTTPTVASPAPQPVSQPGNAQPSAPVGGGTNPQHNPINAFGPLGAKGQLNGNAAFGQKNSPDSSKTAEVEYAGNDPAELKWRDDMQKAMAAWEKKWNVKREDYPPKAKKKQLPAKTASAKPCSCGCGDTVATCKCGPDCACRKPGGSCYKAEKTSASAKDLALLGLPVISGGIGAALGSRMGENNWIHNGENPSDPNGFNASMLGAAWGGLGGAGLGLIPALMNKYETRDSKIQPRQEYLKRWKGYTGLDHLIEKDPTTADKAAAEGGAWTRSEGKNPEGGLSAKGRASLKAQGHDIKAPVTESNPKGERAGRQNSFCARMCGMKKHETGADTKKDPDSRINKSLRKWNCKCSSAYEFGAKMAGLATATARGTLKALREANDNDNNPDYNNDQAEEHTGDPTTGLLTLAGGLGLLAAPRLLGMGAHSRGRRKYT